MNFLDLNVDVKRLILDHLSQPDLLRICLTHPQLHQLARPVLYSSVELPSGFGPNASHPITSLLRTILSQPEVARHIRRLSFISNHTHTTNGVWTRNVEKAPKFPVSPSDLEAAAQFVKECEVPYRDSWIDALQTATMDAYLAVLLVNLPSVDYLRIEPTLLIETEFVGRVLKSSLCDMPPSLVLPAGHPASLQVLRHLSLYRSDYSPIPNTPNILPVFYLPSVKKMTIHVDDPADEFRWPTSTSPQAFGLESLEVEGLHEAHLRNLLSATPSLRSLTWTREYSVESVYSAGPLVPGPIISLHTLRTSLAVVKDTLTKLEIRARDHSVGDRLTDRNRSTNLSFSGPLRSLCLAEFEHLKVLEVPSEFIMGFPASSALEDNLPPNIEDLTISMEASWSFWHEWDFDSLSESPYIQGILKWLPGAKHHTPNIRKFSYLDHSSGYLGYDETDDQDHLAAKQQIQEVASSAGIEYTRHVC